MGDEPADYRSGFFGFWLGVLLSRHGLIFWLPLALTGVGILWQKKFPGSDELPFTIYSLAVVGGGLTLVGFLAAVFGKYAADLEQALQQVEDLRKEKLVRPDIKVEFQRGSGYVPEIRTRELKQKTISERDRMLKELSEYEERIQNATETIERLEERDELRDAQRSELERAREQRETAEQQREKLREIRTDSIAELMREVRKGRLRIDFHFRVLNDSDTIPATLVNVDLEPCADQTNRFSYLPQETVPQGAEEEDEVVIQPNTSLLIRHTAELQIPTGAEFSEFLDELADVEKTDRDCLQFLLSFRSGDHSYVVEFDKPFHLRPIREELLQHWRAYDFEEGLEAIEA